MRSYRLYFHHLNGSGYNIQFWLYPRPLKSRKYKTTVWKSSILCRWSWCIEQLPPSRPIRSATASTFSTFKNPLKTHTMLSNLTSSVMTSLCCCAFVVLLVLLLLLLLLLSSAKLCHIDFQDSGRYVAIFLPVSDWVSHFLEKLNVYQHTKFRQENSVHGWDITICGLENKRPPYWNSSSGFDLDHIPVIDMLFYSMLPNFIQIHMRRSNDVVSIFNMAAAAVQYYFRFRICWHHCLYEVKIYQGAKIGRHDSFHGWHIITSVWEIQTSAMLEFYFRFHFPPYSRNSHDILHKAAKLHP